jgi:hypothetical protein
MIRNTLAASAISLGFALCAACGDPDAEPAPEEVGELGEADQPLSIQFAGNWLWRRSDFPLWVCFYNGNTSADRARFRDVIEGSWENTDTPIDFLGWNPCHPDFPYDIKIDFNSSVGRSQATIGRESGGSVFVKVNIYK